MKTVSQRIMEMDEYKKTDGYYKKGKSVTVTTKLNPDTLEVSEVLSVRTSNSNLIRLSNMKTILKFEDYIAERLKEHKSEEQYTDMFYDEEDEE